MRITVALLLIATLLQSAPTLAQQISGNLEGRVLDADGNPVALVDITVSGPSLAAARGAISSTNGAFRVLALPVGTYVIEASMPGFQSVRQQDVVVSLGQAINVDLQLGDVTVSEEIIVTAEASQVSTVDNGVGFNLGESFIERQPLSRDVTTMMDYAPGVQEQQAYGAPSNAQNAYTMDGVDVSDPELGRRWILPSMDWVEEVQVAGLGADAEYGGFTGGVLNVITKSGGNEFHGDARAYYSGGSLNSESAPEGSEGVNSVKSDIDISASLGGAIIKDRIVMEMVLVMYHIVKITIH